MKSTSLQRAPKERRGNDSRIGAWLIFLFAAVSLTACAGADKMLRTSDGMEIAYEYDRPAGEPRGRVLLLHGLGTGLNEWYNFKKYLLREGWAVFTLDFRGHGLSNWWQRREISWTDFSEDGLKSAVRDAEAAGGLLKEEGPFWIVGSSFGSNVALQYAAREPSVAGVVLLSPGINFAGVESLPALPALGERPVFIAAAEDDPGAPDASREIHAAVRGPKKLEILASGGHGSVMLEESPELKEEIVRWMSLSAAPAAPKNTSE